MATVPSAQVVVRPFAFDLRASGAHSLTHMRLIPCAREHPSRFIVLPLLPIFFVGLFPMLLLSLMGPAGLIILGILIVCAGMTDMLDANSTFSEQIIVHGYARGSDRAGQRRSLQSEIRFAAVMMACRRGPGRRRGCRVGDSRKAAAPGSSHKLVACALRKNLRMEILPAAS